MDRYKMDVVSAGRNYDKVRKCIVAGYFTNAAKKDPQDGYRTMVEGNPVFIHPSSALFNKNPEWLIYHELVLTSKEYMRQVMSIEPKWLIEYVLMFLFECYRKRSKNRLGSRRGSTSRPTAASSQRRKGRRKSNPSTTASTRPAPGAFPSDEARPPKKMRGEWSRKGRDCHKARPARGREMPVLPH